MFTQQFLHFLKHFYQIFGMKGRSTEKKEKKRLLHPLSELKNLEINPNHNLNEI